VILQYYAPESAPEIPSNICKGRVTEILPSEGLDFISNTHLIVDGLTPIIYGPAIRFEENGKWFYTNNRICIVDCQKKRAMDNLHRISDIFNDIAKKAERGLVPCFYSRRQGGR
jgi:hypothetical protein